MKSKGQHKPADLQGILETLSGKIGWVLLILGGMHFFNLFVFSKMRKRALLQNALPPVPPQAYVERAIQLAGALQLVTAVANFFLPAKLHYRENLEKVSPIIRQIFTIHSIYIVLMLLGFGLICLLFPADLGGASPLGRFLCGFLAVFWGLRVVLQVFYYDSAVKKEHPFGALFFGAVFLYLAVVFTAATLLAK